MRHWVTVTRESTFTTHRIRVVANHLMNGIVFFPLPQMSIWCFVVTTLTHRMVVLHFGWVAICTTFPPTNHWPPSILMARHVRMKDTSVRINTQSTHTHFKLDINQWFHKELLPSPFRMTKRVKDSIIHANKQTNKQTPTTRQSLCN